MFFPTTMTQKGQITIPKKMREALGLLPRAKINLRLVDKKKKTIQIEEVPDFFTLAGSLNKYVPKEKLRIDPVKARAYMEKNYERV